MAYSNNGCKNKPCGCEDTPLTSPAPCNPVGCPEPYPCTEVLNAECVVYTDEDITCNQDVVVSQDMNLAEAIQAITTYFCNSSGTIASDILCGQDVVVDAGSTLAEAIQAVVDYFCSNTVDTGWVDLEGFAYYQGSTASSKPQVRRIGKQVFFRGNLYVPLSDGSAIINLTNNNTYETIMRKTPFVGSGGVYVDATNNIFFNSTGSAANPVIPNSVIASGTNLDGAYKLTREVASRKIVVATDPTGDQGEVLLHAYVEISILANKTLRLTALSTLENDGSYPTDFTGSSSLRAITSSFKSRENVINFKNYLLGQSGTNSINQTPIFSGALIVGNAYYILDYNAGDDFTNVGAAANLSGQLFIASGTTPTVWTNSSSLLLIPQAIETHGVFFNDSVSSTTPTSFPVFADGTTFDAADPLNIGGFVISLDGLTAFLQ